MQVKSINFKSISFRKKEEKVFSFMFFLCSLLGIVLVFSIIVFIFLRSLPFFREVSIKDFIFSTRWKPSSKTPSFGIASFIVSSFFMTFLSLLFSVPLALLLSIYISEYADKKIKNLLNSSLNLLASIPSVIVGLLGIKLLVPLVGKLFHNSGYCLLTGSLVLALMLLPSIINVSSVSLSSVDQSLRQASLALASTKTECILKVVLPTAKKGILTSIIMALARAVGETTAVLLVAGNAPLFPKSPSLKTRTMTMNIVSDMSYAEGVHMSSLFATSFLLLIFILVLNVFIMSVTKKRIKK